MYENRANRSTRRRASSAVCAAGVVLMAALALSGCGGSVSDTLIKEAGAHGNALEKVYVLYNQDVISKTSNRDLKDINAALKANNLKQATAGDLRRAQDQIRSRITKLEKFVTKIKAANKSLKRIPPPSFTDGLGDEFANKEFASAYKDTTKNIQRYATSDLIAVRLAFSSLEKYLDFLEQWEQFVNSGDVAELVSTGKASDKAYARLSALSKRFDRRDGLNKKIKPLVDRMAAAASESSQLATLVDAVKKQFPKSFLAKRLVEK